MKATVTEQLLAADVAPNQEKSPAVDELRSFLKEKLPDYMVPSVFVVLDALPLTPNGKVDRDALPAPDRRRSELVEACQEPGTKMESSIAEIWQDVLGLDKVGVHDNFLNLGGHSLLTMKVIERLEKCTGLRLKPSQIMMQSLGQLAATCEEASQSLEGANGAGVTGKLLSAVKSAFPSGARGRKPSGI